MTYTAIETTTGMRKAAAFNPAAETLTNGFFTINDQWTVRYWNKAAEKILKVMAADIIGRNLWEVFADVIPIEFYSINRKIFNAANPVHFKEYWGEMGAWFDVIIYRCDDLVSVSFKSSNNPDAGYSENAAERLRTLSDLYRYVTEITNDCLWQWNLLTEEIFWIDGGHRRVFGYEVENALLPKNFWEQCIHPDDRDRVLEKLKNTIERYVCIWEDEYRFKKADGSYTVVHDRGHITYDRGLCALRMTGATQDISEKIRLEESLENSWVAKMNMLTQPISRQGGAGSLFIFPETIRDLRTPLANIMLAVELLTKERPDDAQREILDIIGRNTDRIDSSLNKILEGL